MNKKSLFDSTKKEVETTAASKLFNDKLNKLQLTRNEKIKKVKEDTKEKNKNGSLFKINAKEELKRKGITPRVTIKDLTELYYNSTGNALNDDTMENIINGKATIANQKLSDLKKFLDKQYPKEIFYLMFENDNSSINYEHHLFFDILNGAQKQINRYIPDSNSTLRGMSPDLSTISLALGDWGTQKIDRMIKELILEVISQLTLVSPQAQIVVKLIEDSDKHPQKSSKSFKIALYDRLFTLMRSFYSQILSYDLHPAYSHNSFRFQTYNQLNNLNRKRIQDTAVINLYIIVNLVSFMLNSLPYPPNYQWNNELGRKELLKAISQKLVVGFNDFSGELGNVFKQNVFS